jgi:hypothetical protein
MAEKAARQADYTLASLRWVLEHYLALAEGQLPSDRLTRPDYGCLIQKSRTLRASYPFN